MKRSRIVLLVENMSFPRDRRVRQEAAALAQFGYEVSVVCPMGTTRDRHSFEVIDNIKVYRYWQPWQGKGVLSYLLEYGWAVLCSFLIVIWIWINDGFDVLHMANPPDLFFLIAAPFLPFKKRFVYDQHDLCPELLEAKLGRAAMLERLLLFLERCSYKLANLIIVTNLSACEVAAKRGALPEKVCIVRNGPDLNYFVHVAKRPALKCGAQYLALYIGSVATQDGVDRVIQAAHHIVYNRGRKDARFAILGDGDCLKELQSLAHALKVEPYIDFAGWVSDDKLLSYISTADVCLAPEPPRSFNQLSTFIKIAEYMCFGKVTVSFDLLESRRTLGPAGVYVDRDDPALFGDAILDILDAPVLREQLGRIAVERVRKSLHWGLSRSALLKAYERLIRDGVPFRVDCAGPDEDIPSGQTKGSACADEV
jgi:glycosyltransferase involved in cell wall biosynthesis